MENVQYMASDRVDIPEPREVYSTEYILTHETNLTQNF